jgi:stage V sporulation protein B
MTKSSFVWGALILLTAAAFNRVLGFVFQAVVFRLIGAEGVGLFNLVYPVYILLIVITTAGIPLALSKMVAEETARGNHAGARRIFHVALTVLLTIGFLITLITYLSLPLLLKYVFVNKKVYICFLAMLPGVFIVAMTSVFRGYFQGMQQMTPPALSQVLEQITRVLTGLLLAYYFLPRGIEYAAAGVAAGGVLGELAGLIVLLTVYFKRVYGYPKTKSVPYPPLPVILREFSRLCTPITAGRILATLLLSIDTYLIPYRLQAAHMTVTEATAQYGLLSGVAMTLLFVPTVLTISLATTLVPAISESTATGHTAAIRKRVHDAVKITVIGGLPFLVLFYAIPGQLIDIIFGSPGGAELLRILALGGLFMYLQQTTTGILQGLGVPTIPLLNMMIAIIFKLPCMYFLLGLPGYGISGAAWAYVIFFAVSAGLNMLYLARKRLLAVEWNSLLIKPGIAAIAMLFILGQTNRFVFALTKSNPLAVISAGLLAIFVYGFFLFATRVITGTDLRKFSRIRR